MYKVFLSYSHEDRDFVNYLALDLQSRGFEVWYDQCGGSVSSPCWKVCVQSNGPRTCCFSLL